ncbi:neuroglian, partial [Clonorchis sinensis]
YLYIAAAIEEDHDTLYTCVANNEVIRYQTNGPSYLLKVFGTQTNYPVKPLYNTPRTEVVTAGDILRLKCIFAGYPPPQYTWYKDGKEPIELPNVNVKNLGTMLEIDPVSVEAAGEYRCQVTNEQTRVTGNMQYTVRVHVRPTFVDKPQDTTVPVNGSVIFTCTATGDPAPQIRWTVNGQDPSTYLDGVRKTLQGNVMHLYNLTVKDTAVIQCNASNAFGYDFVNAYLNVMREPPYFIKPPQAEQRVVDGHEVTIYCQTFSAPKALISWTKDGRPISGGRYRSLITGDLKISSVAITDSGVYECTATNPFGSRKASGRLLVRRRTSIVLAPIDTQVYEDQVVKFVCTAETDPMELHNLEITWYKDDNLIEPNLTPRIQQIWFDYSLVLSGAQPRDTGQYRCNASNGLDYAVASASLLVQGRPEKAIRVEVNCAEFIKDELALVSWYPGSDNYAPIMEYIVEYSTQYERDTWYPAEIFNYTGLVQSTSIKVVLRPAILYQFRIRTRNRVGVSLPSVATSTACGIPARVPATNPSELYIYGSLRNNLIIKWTTMPYIEHYGSNLGYTLKVTCLNCDIIPRTAVNNTVIGDWRTDSITMTSFLVGAKVYEIETYKQFKVSIQSQNEKGESTAPPKIAVGYSGEAVPTIVPPSPTLVNATSKGAVLRWQAITEAQLPQVNGYFRGYRIEWCDASLDVIQCDKQTRFQDVILKIPDTPVFYSRRRRRSIVDFEDTRSLNLLSADGERHLTESVLERYLPELHHKGDSGVYTPMHTQVCRPTPDRNISCPGTGRFPRAAQSPSIMGEAYAYALGRVTRQVRDFPDLPTFVWGQLVEHSLTGVPGNSFVRLWLRVLNTRFAGPMSPVITLNTLEDTPGPVANLQVVTIGVTYADIVWTLPAEPNGIVLGYEFEAKELHGLEMGFGFRFPPLQDGNATQCRLPGLRPNTSYRITVWPFTSAGTGVDTFIDFSTAPSDVAPSPPNFVVTHIGMTNFTVMYEPSHIGIPGTVFFVQYREPGVIHWLESTRTFVQRVISVEELMPVKQKAVGPEVAPLVTSPEYAQPMNGDELADSLSPQRPDYPDRGLGFASTDRRQTGANYPGAEAWLPDEEGGMSDQDGRQQWDDDRDIVHPRNVTSGSPLLSNEEETELEVENSYIASGSELGSIEADPRIRTISKRQPTDAQRSSGNGTISCFTMRSVHLCVLSSMISVIILIHTLRGLSVLDLHLAQEVTESELNSNHFVHSRIESRSFLKIIVDATGSTICVLFWGLAIVVRLRPRDLTEKQYKVYHVISTVLWQLLVVPYLLGSLAHSIYLLFIMLDDAGFVQSETANSLRDAFVSLSSFKPEAYKLKVVNALVEIQRKYTCCGGTSYMDWLELEFVTEKVYDTNKTVFDPWGRHHSSGFFPSSCCDRTKTVSCSETMLNPSVEVTKYHLTYEAPVYRRDCITALYEHKYTELAGLIGLFAAIDICLHALQVFAQLYAYHRSATRYPCITWANRLPPLQSNLTPPKLGSYRESTGSVVHRTGSITHMDGSHTHRDGSVVMPDGSYIPKPEKLVHRSGSVTLRSGSRIHRTGSRTHIDGSRTHRTGSVTFVDGSRLHKDQTITPGPGDSREACMLGDNPQLFFGSTGYISTDRLIQSCQGLHLFAKPSLEQQSDVADKAEWMENIMKIGWIAHGGGKQYCTIVPRVAMRPSRQFGPVQTSEFRRFLRLHIPIVEAIIYTDGNAVLEYEANAYYRGFCISFIRGILFLLLGYVAATVLCPVFLPTNLDTPILNTAYLWSWKPSEREKLDMAISETAVAIHEQITLQVSLLLYSCIMCGALISPRFRCLLFLSIPIFGMQCGHMYLINQMFHAAMLGPVATSERNFVSTSATLECLQEMSFNISRDMSRINWVYPLEDAIKEQSADVLGLSEADFRNVSLGFIELSSELSDNIVTSLMYLYNGTEALRTLGKNQSNLAKRVEKRFDNATAAYLKVANIMTNRLIIPLTDKSNQLVDMSNKVGLARELLEGLQTAISGGREMEEGLYKATVLGCMLVKSVKYSQCKKKSDIVCQAVERTIKSLTHEPAWFKLACPPDNPSEVACPVNEFVTEAEQECYDAPGTLGVQYGVGAFTLEALNALKAIADEFKLGQPISMEESLVPLSNEQWTELADDSYERPYYMSDLMYGLFYILVICSSLGRLLLIGVFYQSHRYISNYLTFVDFDNVYAGSMFEYVDAKRLADGRETLLPLKSMETSQVYWRSRFYTYREIRRVAVNLLRAVVYGCFLLILFAVSWNMKEMATFLIDLTAGYYGMRMRIRQAQFTGNHADVSGDGIFYQLLKKILYNVKQLKAIELNYDPNFCSPYAYSPSSRLERDFYDAWYLLMLLIVVAPLLLRIRHVVASFFYPSRVKNRTVALYNSLLTRRRRHMTTCRNLIVHWVREGRLQEEARKFGHPTFLASIHQRFAQLVGMDKKMCLICQDWINSGPQIAVCTLDKAALCRQCVEVVLRKEICVVCLDRNPKRLFKERRRIQRSENMANMKAEILSPRQLPD